MGFNDHQEKKSRKSAGEPRRVGEGYDAPFRGYINLNLSPEEKDGYAAWAEGGTIWEVLQIQIADGVNVSVKLDPKGQGYLASATQRRSTSPNAGLVVTARAKDAPTCLGRLTYILAILTRDESWEVTQPIADPDRW